MSTADSEPKYADEEAKNQIVANKSTQDVDVDPPASPEPETGEV